MTYTLNVYKGIERSKHISYENQALRGKVLITESTAHHQPVQHNLKIMQFPRS